MISSHPDRAAETASQQEQSTALRYIAALAAVWLLMYVAPFVAERTRGLQHAAASDWGILLDGSYDLAGTNADVVIFGDSTALYGINTSHLSATLGVTVLNLPQTAGSLAINGDDALQRYLATNRRPRVILLTFAPWNRDFASVPDARTYEGVEQAVRHDRPSALLRLARAHTTQVLLFPFQYYLVASDLTRAWKRDPRYRVAARMGFQPHPPGRASLQDGHCKIPSSLLDQKSDASLLALQNKMKQNGTTIVTMLAPVPNCAGVDQLAARFGDALTVLPAHDFVGDDKLVHPQPAFTGVTTERVASILRPYLAEAAPSLR